MGFIDIIYYQIQKKKAKRMEDKTKCKICGELMANKKYSDMPGICKWCGEHI